MRTGVVDEDVQAALVFLDLGGGGGHRGEIGDVELDELDIQVLLLLDFGAVGMYQTPRMHGRSVLKRTLPLLPPILSERRDTRCGP